MPQKQNNRVHLVGIGGIGVSALAQFYLSQNWQVSGSDLQSSEITRSLAQKGVKISHKHLKSNITGKISVVIRSPAVSPDNPEIKKAEQLKIPVLSYPQALGQLTRKHKTVAVAGTHGKSSTVGLIALMAIKNRLDPTVIVGAKIKEFDPPQGTNFRAGKSNLLIIEADEWQASFLNYSPSLAIITNIDNDHLDYYKNLTQIQNAFLQFIQTLKNNGVLILNRDDKNILAIKSSIGKIASDKNLKILWYSLASSKSKIKKLKPKIKLFGRHNYSNLLAALKAAEALGIKESKALNAIKNFGGAWRRLEKKGVFKTNSQAFTVFDDYAHHPTEVKATLSALKAKDQASLICVFQPHLQKRLKQLFAEFEAAFQESDCTIILPAYKAPGRDLKGKLNLSQKLANSISKSGKPAVFVNQFSEIKPEIQIFAQQCPNRKKFNVVMMGAGDIFSFTPLLLKQKIS